MLNILFATCLIGLTLTRFWFIYFQIYDEKELLEGKLELLSNTNMVDFAIDVYQRLHPDNEAPPELYDKRQVVVAELRQLQAVTEPVLDIILRPEISNEIEKSRDSRQLLEFLQTRHDVCICLMCD